MAPVPSGEEEISPPFMDDVQHEQIALAGAATRPKDEDEMEAPPPKSTADQDVFARNDQQKSHMAYLASLFATAAAGAPKVPSWDSVPPADQELTPSFAARLAAWMTSDQEDGEDDEMMDETQAVSSERRFHSIGFLPSIQIKHDLRVLAKWYLLAAVILIPGIIFWLVHYADACPRLQGVCVSMWFFWACIMVASLPTCNFVCKIAVHFVQDSRLMHINYLFFVVQMHEQIAVLMWTVILFCFWKYAVVTAPDVTASSKTEAVTKVIGCLVAWSVLRAATKYLLLLLAQKSLWQHYSSRIQASLLTQYVFLILSDLGYNGIIREGDEASTLEMAALTRSRQTISICAVMRIMFWIPQTTLLPDSGFHETDGETTKSARRFAGSLFIHLLHEAEKARNRSVGYSSPRSKLEKLGVVRPLLLPIQNLTSRVVNSLRQSSAATQSAPLSPPRDLSGIEEDEVLTEQSFSYIMSVQLAREIMASLDVNSTGYVSRGKFVAAFVAMYRERRSLVQSIKDYDLIIQKMGLMLRAIMYIVLVITCLFIFELDVRKLAVTSIPIIASLSFSFRGSIAGLLESIVFIFVTRAYDVGDRVMFADSGEALPFMVKSISLLSTVFVGWDLQPFCVPNRNLAAKQISNLDRSARLKIKKGFEIDAKTPIHVFQSMQDHLVQWVANKKGLSITPGSIAVLRKSITNPSLVSAVLSYAKRISRGQQYTLHEDSLLLQEFVAICKQLGARLNQTPQVVRIQKEVEVPATQ